MVKEVNKEHKNVEMTRKKKRRGIVYFNYSGLEKWIFFVGELKHKKQLYFC